MNNNTTNYTYDANGNLLNDPYKGIGLQYNVLNKTDKETLTYNVTGSRYIEYIYDAGGSVLRKIAYDSSAGTTQTDYIDGFVYTNGTLAYFPSPEGRVLYNGSTYTNEYTITDQQGNARISFNNTGTGGTRQVVQENSYYGFGMVLPNSPVTGGSNKNLYNGGSEWQNDFQNQPDYYQTPARNYDASLGRFVSADPVAESAASMSAYHYAGDNPIMMNDPTGNHAAPVGRTTNLLWAQEVQDPNFQWFASNSDAEMSQWVSSLGASGAGGGAGFAAGDLGEEEAEFDAFSAYTTAYGNAVMRDQSADYSTFWNTALSVGNAIAQGLGANDNGWHFSGSGFNSLVGLAGALGDNESLNLTAYSNGASTMSLQFGSPAAQANIAYHSMNGSQSYNIGPFSVSWHTTSLNAAININYTAPPASMLMYQSYQWIQTVSSSGEYDRLNGVDLAEPHVDGTRDDDTKTLINYPFYFTKLDLAINSVPLFSSYAASMRDYPSGESWFSAETTLVGIGFDSRLIPLGTFRWGYVQDYMSGAILMGRPQFYPYPSGFQNGIIQNYNSRIH